MISSEIKIDFFQKNKDEIIQNMKMTPPNNWKTTKNTQRITAYTAAIYNALRYFANFSFKFTPGFLTFFYIFQISLKVLNLGI